MKNMKTLKILSILLALVMILLTLPLSSFSVDLDELTDPNENWIEELIWELIYKPLLKPVVATKGLPENAEANIKVADNPFTRKSSSNVGTFLDFYDISVKDTVTGEEIHPVGEVEVTIESARIKSGQSVYILHVLDDENVIKNSKDAKNFKLISEKTFVTAFKTASAAAEKALGKKGVVAVEIIDDVKVEGRNITFKTNCFSIFAVVDEPILTVNFYKDATTKVASIRVKARDVEDDEEFESIVYDPGVNDALEDDVLFRGWFETPDYTVDDAEHNALTIAQVREKIAAKLATNYSDGDEINFYAMLYKKYTVTYFDQAGKVCLGRDFVLQRADTEMGEMDYQVTLNYVPYGQFENFEGWKLKTGDKNEGDGFYTSQTGHMVGVYTTTPPDGTPEITGNNAINYIYTTPTWTRISGDIYLQAESPEGNWLVFDENGKGGTYVAPQFVKKGQATVDPEQDPDSGVVMQRYGYTFGGWYDSKEHADAHADNPSVTTGKFTFGGQLNDNITIYASWIPNETANYTVLIWKQNVAGDGYDFAESVTINGTVGSTINSVTSTGTGNSAYATVNGSAKRYTGFHLKEYDQNVTIVPEGTSILNVYYDRNVVTLTFQVYSNSGGTYVITNATTGTIYGYVDGAYVRIYTDDGGQTWYTTSSVDYVEDPDGQYGYVDGDYVFLTDVNGTYYYTDDAQYAANTVGSPKYGLVNGQYIQLTERNGSYYYVSGQEDQYVPTTNYSNNGLTKYAILGRTDTQLVDGVYTELDRVNANNFRYRIYTASNAADYTMYGLIDGTYVQLTRQNEGSWINPEYHYYYNNVEYTGQRYTRSWSANTRWDSTTIYVVQTVDVEVEYTGTVYTHAIPYTGTLYSPDATPYTGERFEYSGTTGWKTIHQFSGLYGSTLESNGYTWPANYWWYDDYQGSAPYSGDGTRTTFLDAFILSSGESEETYYGFAGSGTNTIRFYKWDGVNANFNINNPTNTSTSGNARFNISDKYNGYRAHSYSTNGTTWTTLPATPGSNGYYATVDSGYTNLYIRFVPRQYNILYMDGQYVDGNNNPVTGYSSRGELHVIENVNYASDLSSYNKGGTDYYVPDDFAGFVFEGWYLDDACTHPYTFTTMTEGITVYAKWRQVQYRVFLHANAGEVVYDDQGNIVSDTRDESLDWGSEGQQMNFRVSYGGTISVPTGLRDDYVFAGWYTDPECTKSFIPASQLNNQTVSSAYDKTTDMTDDMDQWSCLGPDPWNSDAIGYQGGDRFWITQKLDLYAKWRSKIVGADGMYVKYVTTDPDIDNDENVSTDDPGTGHFPEGTSYVNSDRTEYCDGEIYADGAFAYGLAACDAPTVAQGQDELHFRYWVVQEWDASLNGGQGGFTDSDTIVYPGERFDTVYRYAQRVDVDPSDPSYNKPGTEGYDPDKADHYYDYYMVLRAEYTPAVPQDTTLVYDANGGDFTSVPTGYTANTADGYNVIVKDTLLVNEVFDIQPGTIVTREGYDFAGWSLIRDGDKFLDGGEQNYAADNLTTNPEGNDPSNTLYAIWVVQKYNVVVKKAIDNYGVSDATWDAHKFAFHYSITNGGEYNVSDALVTTDGVSVENSADGSVLITNVPYGSTLCVWEVLTDYEARFFTTDHSAENMYVLSGFVSDNDGDTLTEIVTITNTRVLGKIVVSKTVTTVTNGNEFDTEKFMFKLELLKTVDGETVVDESFTPMILTLSASGSASVQVPAGKYRVTELTDWSWRYNATSATSVDCEITANNPNATAPFTNRRNAKNWLCGEYSKDNAFTGGATTK